ncbi:MAG TPA: helix-turn-helix transcriptional regulator [Solidesulfovibrio magneticus]|nr:helix-turn-helix transcriptional regulator [Solidesulfovibrio magneticus]
MTDEAKSLCASLIRQLIAAYGLKDSEFGKALGLARQTISNYTTGKSEPNWSILNAIIEKYDINPIWLMTGQGDMRGRGLPAQGLPAQGLPSEELNAALTPAQREMLTYKRTMLELGASPDRIIDGIEAIAMGKTTQPKSARPYSTAESPANPGYNNVHEPGADFGTGI